MELPDELAARAACRTGTVTACYARGVNPHLIVSGDKDLPVPGPFDGIPIVTAVRAVELTKAT